MIVAAIGGKTGKIQNDAECAELIGSVRTIPMTTETTMPMMNLPPFRCPVDDGPPRPVITSGDRRSDKQSGQREPAPMVMTGSHDDINLGLAGNQDGRR